MTTTFVLLPGAGSDSWYWHLVAPRLRSEGYDVLTPDLPWTDAGAGLAEYTDVVVDAIGERSGVVLVAQSMSGFVAPMVCERVPVELMILVAAMTPKSGESPGEWWAATGQEQAQREKADREGRAVEFDVREMFFHDVPDEVTEQAFERGEHNPSDTPFQKPWPLAAWPDVPTRFLLCRDDRLFPAEFQRRVVEQRLGIVPDEMEGGHLPALARPEELTEKLLAYVRSS
ncbi:alpha/beta fold hydrolase [Prauserella cavernicola]|uniref:Alpha/beta hydrolase n=1 Tax=Prauserella cavernicola TaxID=2800127 RepID=A0A934QRM3_9PSEU|nr:alpha/beta hydrolase [Prauserella cavernicola]MBK1785300.1 alpha/beta hydrolase [Prauserella cavernicola]